jgi:hypothetical protein
MTYSIANPLQNLTAQVTIANRLQNLSKQVLNFMANNLHNFTK